MNHARIRPILLIVAAAMLFLIVLAGCGDDQDNQEDDSSSSTAPTEAVEANEPTAEQSSPTEVAETPTEPANVTPIEEATPTAEAAGDFPVTVTRTDGVGLTIEERPERIVSLSPGATETFFAIGAGDQLVAADMFSNYPPVAEALPKVDAYQPDLEAILELDPDLVFVIFDAEGLVQNLEDLGIPVLFLDAPTSVDGMIEQVRVLGKVTGNTAPAEEVADSMSQRVSDIRERVEGIDDAPSVYHELDEFHFTVGPGTFVGDLYKILGAENIVDESLGDYPQLSEEVILERNPEVIVVPSGGGETGITAQDVKQRDGWDVVDAVQNDRVYEIDPDVVSRPGPRIVDALELLAPMLYPEEFGMVDGDNVGRYGLRSAA